MLIWIGSLTLLLAGQAVIASAQTAPVTLDGFTYIKSVGGIHEYQLDANGLDVLIKPDTSVPVASFQVTYRVGSRNEVTGTTGATHLLEHLMFKGTDHFNRRKGNSLDQYLESVGAGYNASTWLDRTNYFATLRSDNLDGYVAIESDRMRNLWLRESDRHAEMTVVRNEYERGENDPSAALATEVYASAFMAQPYHHSTIGWKTDIERVPIGKLKEFYDTFYWPDNATVTIVGNVELQKALELIKKYYGSIPRAPHLLPAVYTEEPPQTGPRRVTLKRAGELGSVLIGYKGPAGLDADMPALSVLSSILSGGENSRLSRALLDKSLVTYAEADIQPTHDPGLFLIDVGLAPQITHEQVEKAILAEIDEVKKDGVTAEEVKRVVSQYRAEQAYQRDGTAGTAGALNEWIATGDWTQFVSYPARVSAVTPADVQRVAQRYLNEDQSTTGWFVPTGSK